MQKRFIEHEAPLQSFEANEKYAGILPPSVYRGFDNIEDASGYVLTIGHSQTGEIFTDKELDSTNPRGIWTSKQGVVVKEDEPIQVTVSANPNNYERWDLLVAEHIYDTLNQGGTAAIYTIIPGTNQTEPTSIDNTQTIIGRLKVPANTTNANSSAIVWERRPIPQLGGKFPALLAENNKFTAQNSDNHVQVATITQNLGGASKGIVQQISNANSFLVNNPANFSLDLLPARPVGTEITLTFNNDINIRGFSNQLVGTSNELVGYNLGYRPMSIFITDPSASFKILAGESIVLRMVEVTGTTSRRPHSQYWSLVGATDAMGKSLNSYETLQLLSIRVNNVENNINTLTQNVSVVAQNLNNHEGNTNNPHGVTKGQVGLGNIPNNKSDDPNLDDSESLATSKALKTLKDEVTQTANQASEDATNALENALPKGAIIMWSGSIDTIPNGYVLCDGRPAINNLNIPDLRNKFIRGASDLANTTGLDPDSRGQIASPAAPGAQGGNNRHQITLNQMPPHNHQMPNQLTINTRGAAGSDGFYRVNGEYVTRNTSTVGGTNGTAQEFNIMPQWYALAFIIKVI